MKIYFHLKQLLFVSLLSVSIAHINAKTMDSNPQSNESENNATEISTDQNETANKKETIEELKKLILKMITEIDFALETLATYISSDDVTPKDKEQVLNNIRELRRGVSTIARDIMMYADMTALTRTLKFVTAVQEHIKKAVNGGLQEFPQFDIESLQLRSVVEIAPDEMKEEIKSLKDDLDIIKKKAEEAGISLSNKLYRNIVNPPLEWIAKNNLHEKAGWATVITAAAVYFWYRISEDTVGCRDEVTGELLQVYDRKLRESLFYDKDGSSKILGSMCTDKNFDYKPVLVKDINFDTTSWSQWITECLYPKANVAMRDLLGRTHIGELDAKEFDQTFYNGLSRGKLGRIDTFLTSFNAGSVALGSYYFWPRISQFYNDSVTPNIDKIKKAFFDFHCRRMGGIYYKNNKNKSHKPFKINPRYRFKDIIGCEDIKLTGREIIEFINDTEKFQRQGIVPPKGILLHGPPGTGKSYFAEALCGEVIDALKEHDRDEKEFGFFIIKSTHIQQMGLENILSLMKQWAPCIVFIDEIDLLKLQRDRDSDRLSEALSGLSGFLSETDPKKQVIIIGATNRKENVDEALTRPGRLSKTLYMDYPTFKDRLEFLMRTLTDRINPDLFDLEKLARQTGGCTVEDLRSIINTALFKTRVSAQPLTQKDLENALNSEVRKIVLHQELDLSTEEQRILAIHMAGHAVAHMHLPTKKLLSTITIKPTTEKMREESVWHRYYKEQEPGQIFGKLFTYCPHDTLGTSNTHILLNECKILLAGGLAEEILLGSISSNNKRTCSGTCKPNAFNIAKQILLKGLDEDQLSKRMKEEMLTKAHQLLQEIEKEVTALLEQQKPLLMFIADTLVEQKTLEYDEIMFTLQQAYEQAVKENPELIKELEKQMQEQANALSDSNTSNSNETTRQAISDELGIQEESVTEQDTK